MTELQLRAQELEETKRSNRAREAAGAAQASAAVSETSRKAARDKWERVHSGIKNVTDAAHKAAGIGALLANDPTWYNRVKGTVEHVGKLAFETPFNKSHTPGIMDPSVLKTTDVPSSYGAPGVIRAEFIPTIGRAQGSRDDAINRAMDKLYIYIRSKNAGTLKGDPADFALGIFVGDQINMLLAWVRRTMKLAHKSDYYNYAYPSKLISDLGVDYHDLVSNYEDYIGRYNSVIDLIQALPLVDGFSLYDRHEWLCNYVWKDRDGDPAQLFMYNPYIVYRYDATNGKMQAFKLSQILSSGNGKLDYVFNFIESMYNAYLDNPNIVDINVQILKAFPTNGLIRWKTFEEYEDKPVINYDKEVLEQFHNSESMMIRPSARTSESFDITQNSAGLLVNTPSYVGNSAYAYNYFSAVGADNIMTAYDHNNALDSIQSDDPDPSAVMVMSRFKFHRLVTYNNNSVTEQAGDFASEIISHYHMTIFNETLQNKSFDFTSFTFIDEDGYYTSNLTYNLHWLLYALSTFKAHPRWFGIYYSAKEGNAYSIPVWDISRLAAYPYANLIKMNNVATLSLFYNAAIELPTN